MKSITLHNLDNQTVAVIEKMAQEQGKSLNKTIKQILHQALGISESGSKEDEFAEFIGSWSEEDVRDFNRSTSEFGKITPLDWQ